MFGKRTHHSTINSALKMKMLLRDLTQRTINSPDSWQEQLHDLVKIKLLHSVNWCILPFFFFVVLFIYFMFMLYVSVCFARCCCCFCQILILFITWRLRNRTYFIPIQQSQQKLSKHCDVGTTPLWRHYVSLLQSCSKVACVKNRRLCYAAATSLLRRLSGVLTSL